MPTVIGGNNSLYPSLEEIASLVRSIVNDDMPGATGTPGEGQVFTDNAALSPMTLNFLNSSIRALYRELRNIGSPTLIKDHYILSGLTPVNELYRIGAPDPSTQVNISFNGYFDGQQINPSFALPPDCLMVLRMWERTSGTADSFMPMEEARAGLASRNQQLMFADWEWRGDAVWMMGALINRDVRTRYQSVFPNFLGGFIDFTNTFVPVQDCTEAVAYRVAARVAMRLGEGSYDKLDTSAEKHMAHLKNEHVRRMQAQDYERQPYGNDDGLGLDSMEF